MTIQDIVFNPYFGFSGWIFTVLPVVYGWFQKKKKDQCQIENLDLKKEIESYKLEIKTLNSKIQIRQEVNVKDQANYVGTNSGNININH